MKKFLSILILISLLSGCVSRKSVKGVFSTNFIKLDNNNAMGMKLDGLIVPDKQFTIELPLNLKKRHDIVGDNFTHIFEYKQNEEILLIYIPWGRSGSDQTEQLLNVSSKIFLSFIEKEKIDLPLSDIKILKHRHFGIKSFIKHQYYALYLNVKKRDIDKYDHSINSVRLK